MKDYFFRFSDEIFKNLPGDELLACELFAENSSFVRLNNGKIRQAGDVKQAQLSLTLSLGKKVVSGSFDLSLNWDIDINSGIELLLKLRSNLAYLREDPYFNFNNNISETDIDTRNQGAATKSEMVEDIFELYQGLDLVGVLSSGEIMRGFTSSLGHRKFVQRSSFNFDNACYLAGDKAVKSNYAGTKWNREQLALKVADVRKKLKILSLPSKTIKPGKYRVYLSPAAVIEIVSMLNWGGFSKKAIETKSSPLNFLVEGKRHFDHRVSFRQDLDQGFSATFDGQGFDLPSKVVLVEKGKYKNALVSSRSAIEFNQQVNCGTEYSCSINMEEGDLSSDKIESELGEGLLISNLWYLNFSDKSAGRITGMTRFATFWVENGRITSPVEVMRFDDSIFDIFGSKLEKLTKEREYILAPGTYSKRSTDSALLPGLLVSDFELTL